MYESSHVSNEAIVKSLQKRFNPVLFRKLLWRFKNLCYKNRLKYRIDYFDSDDYWQEAQIVLYESVQDFDFKRGRYFATYYALRYNRHMSNMARDSRAVKRGGKAITISLNNKVQAEESETELMDLVLNPYSVRPDEVVVIREKQDCYFTRLSPLERDVYKAFMEGSELHEVVELLGVSPARVKNALMRCRAKLKNYFHE